MTDNQRELIKDMNTLCREKCDLNTNEKQTKEYISRNIEEYQLAILYKIRSGYGLC